MSEPLATSASAKAPMPMGEYSPSKRPLSNQTPHKWLDARLSLSSDVLALRPSASGSASCGTRVLCASVTEAHPRSSCEIASRLVGRSPAILLFRSSSSALSLTAMSSPRPKASPISAPSSSVLRHHASQRHGAAALVGSRRPRQRAHAV